MEEIRDCPTCHEVYPSEGRRIHELLCPGLSSAGPPPGDNYVLGILLSEAPPSAVAEWVKCDKSIDDETSISFQSVDVGPFFPGNAVPEAMYTERNPRRNRDTASMLEIWTVQGGSGAELAPNQTISTAADGLALHHSWTGPVLALAMTRATGFMVDPGQYKDVSLEDCVDVIDFLLDYGNPDHGARLRAALNSLGAQPEAEVRVAAEVESAEGEEGEEHRVFEM